MRQFHVQSRMCVFFSTFNPFKTDNHLKTARNYRQCLFISFVLVRDRSRLRHKPDYRLGWSSEYVRKSMYACRSVSVACRPAEKRRRCGEIGSIHRSILIGHQRYPIHLKGLIVQQLRSKLLLSVLNMNIAFIF